MALNVAVSPFGVSVPPAGEAAHVTPPVHDAFALIVAVSVADVVVVIDVEFALTPTLETVQVGVVLVGPLSDPPQAA